eukprot:m.294610 g.294610  ORF g.294610 m.294610 type:complete len:1754 (-) comp15849_c2_seq1:361-5622(-)
MPPRRMASRSRGYSQRTQSSQKKWEDTLEAGLGENEDFAGGNCWQTTVYYSFIALCFCAVLVSCMAAKISYLNMAVNANDSNTQSFEPTKGHEFCRGHQFEQRNVFQFAIWLIILIPLVWQFLWQFFATPLRQHPKHRWPKVKEWLFIVVTSMLEPVGIILFTFYAAVKLHPMVSLSLMCIVALVPPQALVSSLRKCFKQRHSFKATLISASYRDASDMPGSRAYSVSQEEDEDDLDITSHYSDNVALLGTGNVPSTDTNSNVRVALSTIGWLGQLGTIVVLCTMNQWHHSNFDILHLYLAPISLLLLSISWSPTLHGYFGVQLNTAQRKQNADIPMHPINEQPAERRTRLQSRRPDDKELSAFCSTHARSAFISHFVKVAAALITPVIIHAIDTDFFEYGDKLVCGLQFKEVWRPLLINLGSSWIAYHAGKYSIMIGSQISGFFLPMMLALPATIGLLALAAKYEAFDFIGLKDTLPYNWDWFMVGASYISFFLTIYDRLATTRTPRLALSEILFYQPGFCSSFVSEFPLMSRRPPNELKKLAQSQDLFVKSTEDELEETSLFICTTMYQESKEEMTQLVASVIAAGTELVHQCKKLESHIFMDGGSKRDAHSATAQQLLDVITTCARRHMEKVMKLKSSTIDNRFKHNVVQTSTPYGMRVVFSCFASTRDEDSRQFTVTVHLKDPSKVKKKKRWSQVMYMFYIIKYHLDGKDFDQTADTSKAYILATDADIAFKKQDVVALAMMLARDTSVGAVCGRTYPTGSGPLVWYQMFDYAIGHWFQKVAEHVLGTVLCCPGCFSMYRVDSLRNVVQEYASHVDKPFQFLIKDMGEDRWLCTLLIKEGWRLDYCAVAKDSTQCPEDFDEFYNQRRRWIVSTMANMVEVLHYAPKAVRANSSVSWLYMLYTGLMLASTVLSPAVVLLVMVGGFAYIWTVPLYIVELILFTMTLIYLLVCLFASQKKQLLVAKLLTGLCAIAMCVVFIGLLAQVAENMHDAFGHNSTSTASTTPGHGPVRPTKPFVLHDQSVMNYTTIPVAPALDDGYNMSFSTTAPLDLLFGGSTSSATTHGDHPHIGSGPNDVSVSSIYLLVMIAMFLIAGLLHLGELMALIHGVVYLLALPSGYLFLIIYSCCNLDDRSWGTRTAEKVEQGGPTSRGRQVSWWMDFLIGCGLRTGESCTHFVGRCMCCKKYDDVEQTVVEQIVEAREPPEEDFAWTIVPQTAGGGRHKKVDSYQLRSCFITSLLDTLACPSSPQEVQFAFAEAVRACPQLLLSHNPEALRSCPVLSSQDSSQSLCAVRSVGFLDSVAMPTTQVVAQQSSVDADLGSPDEPDSDQDEVAHSQWYDQEEQDEESQSGDVGVYGGAPNWARYWDRVAFKLQDGFARRICSDSDLQSQIIQHVEQTMSMLSEVFTQDANKHLEISQQTRTLQQQQQQQADIVHHEHSFMADITPTMPIASLFHIYCWSMEDPEVADVCERLIDAGFENAALLSYLRDQDIERLGIRALVKGPAFARELKLRVQDLRAMRHVEFNLGSDELDIGEAVQRWLKDCGMLMYYPHFEWTGFTVASSLFADLDQALLNRIGITKPGHVLRLLECKRAIVACVTSWEEKQQSRRKVEQSRLNYHQSKLSDDETGFWQALNTKYLGAGSTGNEDSLKQGLRSLRNRTVLGVVTLNLIWLILILALNGYKTDPLKVAGTNPLGLMFIFTYGLLFVIQFLTMLVHRFNTLLAYIATMSVTNTFRRKPTRPRNDSFMIEA